MQNLLLLVIVLLVVGLAFTVVWWPGGMHMTFSQHAAATQWSKVYYSLLFLVTLPLLMWFVAGWLVPTKQLPQAFVWVAGVAVAFQIACTWVPEEGGVKTKVHRVLTGISGVAMLPLVVMVALSPSVPAVVQVVAWAGLAVMVALLGVALAHQKSFRWALWLQIGYYAAFFVVLLAATYSGGTKTTQSRTNLYYDRNGCAQSRSGGIHPDFCVRQ